MPIRYVSFPAIMGKSAVGFEREASFDDHVDATDLRDADLQIALESSRPNDHAQDGLLPCLRAAIDVLLEVAQPIRTRFEYSVNLVARHSPHEKRVVDRCERQPRRLAEQSLREGIHSLMAATHQVAHAGSPKQSERALEVLTEARRKLYAILAEDEQKRGDDA